MNTEQIEYICFQYLFTVYADGGICLDILQNRWSPTYDVSSILTSIQVCSFFSFLILLLLLEKIMFSVEISKFLKIIVLGQFNNYISDVIDDIMLPHRSHLSMMLFSFIYLFIYFIYLFILITQARLCLRMMAVISLMWACI